MCLVSVQRGGTCSLVLWYLSRQGCTVPLVLAATVVAYYIEPGMQFNRNNGRRCSVALD